MSKDRRSWFVTELLGDTLFLGDTLLLGDTLRSLLGIPLVLS